MNPTTKIKAALAAQGYGAEFDAIVELMPPQFAAAMAVVLERKDAKASANYRQLIDARASVSRLKARRTHYQTRVAALEAELRTERAKGLAPCRHELTEGHTRTIIQSKAIGAWVCVDHYSDSDEFGTYTDLAHVWAGDVDILKIITPHLADKVLLEVIQAARNPEV